MNTRRHVESGACRAAHRQNAGITGMIAFLLGIAAGAPAAWAADPGTPAATAAGPSEVPEEIIVTGSRISRRDYNAESPIATLSSSAIAAAGQPSLDRVIGQMPQFEPAQGAAEVGDVQGSVGFGGGASYSDLRGIGRNRSLVLMDGRRLMPSTPDGAIDLNTIPMALIDSVEVITGGASATYGSDAVAGVANFKLKQTFSGVELNVQHGASTNGDGGTTHVSGTLSARATGMSGNGGMVETSGLHTDLNGIAVDTSAAYGKTGSWLIDPTDFTIAVQSGCTSMSRMKDWSILMRLNGSLRR